MRETLKLESQEGRAWCSQPDDISVSVLWSWLSACCPLRVLVSSPVLSTVSILSPCWCVCPFPPFPGLPVSSHLRLQCREQVSPLLHAHCKGLFSLTGHLTWGGIGWYRICLYSACKYLKLLELDLWNECTHQPSDGHSLILGMAKLASK